MYFVVQVTRFSCPTPKWWHSDRLWLGTGLVSMMGVRCRLSFSWLRYAL